MFFNVPKHTFRNLQKLSKFSPIDFLQVSAFARSGGRSARPPPLGQIGLTVSTPFVSNRQCSVGSLFHQSVFRSGRTNGMRGLIGFRELYWALQEESRMPLQRPDEAGEKRRENREIERIVYQARSLGELGTDIDFLPGLLDGSRIIVSPITTMMSVRVGVKKVLTPWQSAR